MPDRESEGLKMDRKIKVLGWLEGLSQDDWMKWHSDSEVQNIASAALELLKEQEADESKYEYHIDHTNCPWYISGEESKCPVTCSQYRDGWNDAMNYIFRNGDGYRPYDRIRKGR